MLAGTAVSAPGSAEGGPVAKLRAVQAVAQKRPSGLALGAGPSSQHGVWLPLQQTNESQGLSAIGNLMAEVASCYFATFIRSESLGPAHTPFTSTLTELPLKAPRRP